MSEDDNVHNPTERDRFEMVVVFMIIPLVTALLVGIILEGALGSLLAGGVGIIVGLVTALVVSRISPIALVAKESSGPGGRPKDFVERHFWLVMAITFMALCALVVAVVMYVQSHPGSVPWFILSRG